jgi:putative ATP-dependent endonuclease of OLD family
MGPQYANKNLIANFRGLEAFSWAPGLENLLLGENNSGKSAILAALNLALAPSTARSAGITDFDFFRRQMRPTDVGPGRRIRITVSLSHLTDDEQRRFFEYLEPLDTATGRALEEAETPAVIDNAGDVGLPP